MAIVVRPLMVTLTLAFVTLPLSHREQRTKVEKKMARKEGRRAEGFISALSSRFFSELNE